MTGTSSSSQGLLLLRLHHLQRQLQQLLPHMLHSRTTITQHMTQPLACQ
jgi:hypothetical protein